jgi:hypothetical protein
MEFIMIKPIVYAANNNANQSNDGESLVNRIIINGSAAGRASTDVVAGIAVGTLIGAYTGMLSGVAKGLAVNKVAMPAWLAARMQ